MKQTEIIMGMPITIEIAGEEASQNSLKKIFDYFKYVDEKFSTYKKDSEIMQINRGELEEKDWSDDVKKVFKLSEQTKRETGNYFQIKKFDGSYDPSGIVKGWSIHKAALLLKNIGHENFCIEAGGDIETSGVNSEGRPWRIGIRNPFKNEEIVKVLESKNKGIATSGNYIRGAHIYNPKNKGAEIEDIVSLTVVGPDVYEADRFATAAFAMGTDGIMFIENLPGFEGYLINKDGVATMTSGFKQYVIC